MSEIDRSWYPEARYGLFVHYGLYSMLERGEWVMNRERIPREEYRELAGRFNPASFDANAICDLAIHAGMRYVVFTTMHHDGFRLYDTALSPFNSVAACGRDLTAEMIAAARNRGLKIALYHSLNNWMDLPDASDALEDPAAYGTFIDATFERVRELVTKYNPIDTLWYDGWWPFNAEGWRGEEMNAMVRDIQPHILFNGRNGLPGDFATPEGHLGAPNPWRPWEGCITMNDSWGFHRGDHNWKSAGQTIDLLATCAQGRGNLLLNIGPRGDGSVPKESSQVLEDVGRWLTYAGEAIFDTDKFTFDLQARGDHRADWNSHGPFTARGNNLYLLARRWPGETFVIGGLQTDVERAWLLGADGPKAVSFKQEGDRLQLLGLPAEPPDALCPVLRFECSAPPSIYLSGGMRIPAAEHPHYDPCPSDIAH